ncbi:MAG TPA: DUF3043 domain-containing protein [Nocardioidaceae bacterium]
MFRRTKSAEKTAEPAEVRPGTKGRPTPSRKEAEAAARARAKAAQKGKAAGKSSRQQRAQQSARMREAMRTGDERYLPARDQGKVRRFTRDFVDSRICMAEFLLPLLVVIMVTQAMGYQSFANGLWMATILLVAVDTVVLVYRLRREVARRFPGEDTKGTTMYGVLRSTQLRFLRMPKPQVKLGQKPPQRY